MTRGTARFVAITSLLMVTLGVTNFAMNGARQWGSWVLVGLGLFSAAQAWRSTRGQSGSSGAFALRWRLLAAFMLGAVALGAVMAVLHLSQVVELVAVGVYAAVAVAVLLLLPARPVQPD